MFRVSRAVPALLVLGISACESSITPVERDGEDATAATDRSMAATGSSSASSCLTCTFEPRLYTLSTTGSVTDVIAFGANPEAAYHLEVDALRTRSASLIVVLNGRLLNVRSGRPEPVELKGYNNLVVYLTGNRGSKLLVKVYQEISSIVVTPVTATARMPATQLFTAVARDLNGIEIPGQTFTWESPDDSVATIDPVTGVARTVGLDYQLDKFAYVTRSTGAGDAAIVARADGASEKSAIATWKVVAGFVYTTYQAPRRLNDPDRTVEGAEEFLRRDIPQPYDYDEPRLQQMKAACARESRNQAWSPAAEDLTRSFSQRQFQQCYPQLDIFTPTRQWIPPTFFTSGRYVPTGPITNIGLYGRYCGGGFPDPWWQSHAVQGNYQPKDPIDALCMEHDLASDRHGEAGTSPQGACIVRYGIQNETLQWEGDRILPGSPEWVEFWSRWPEMWEARVHWLATTHACTDLAYLNFLRNRGLI